MMIASNEKDFDLKKKQLQKQKNSFVVQLKF